MGALAQQWLGYLLSVGLRGGALLALAALATLALRRRSASARHLVWAAGLAALAAVTALSWLLPAWRLEALPARPLTIILHGGDGPAGGALLAGAAPPALTAATAPLAVSAPAAPGWLPVVIFALWAAGAITLLLRLMMGLRGAARVMRGSLAPGDARLSALAAQVAARAGLRWTAEVRLSPAAASPVTAGLLRPIILLPLDAPSWPTELLRAVLAHELGHVRRHDCTSQLLARVVLALHWWNPLCWLAERRMVVERERACDDHVLADGVRASAYARQLLELGGRVQGRVAPALAAAAGQGAFIVGCDKLVPRVETLLDADRSHRLPGRRVVLGAVAAALLLAVPAACLTGDPLTDADATLLVYRVRPDQQAETAAVLARRLDGMGLTKARVTRVGQDRLEVQLPAQSGPRIDVAGVRAALARKGALVLSLVASDREYAQRLSAHLWANPEARRLAGGDIQVVREHWRSGEDGQMSLSEPYLRGSITALRWYLANLPAALQPPAGYALVLDPFEIDQARTLLVDRRTGLTLVHMAEAQVVDSVPKDPELFEVKLTVAPDDAARLHALTAANVGKRMALELDDGELWGAPVIRSPMSERVSVTSRGSRAEAERLAAAFRAGTLPAPIELVFSGGTSTAVGLRAAAPPRR